MIFGVRQHARRLQRALPAVLWIFLFVYAIWPWIAPRSHTPRTVVFYGFSILGEALNQIVFPEFQKEWAGRTGEIVEFASSFAGSGTVTNQLIMGVPAQLALLALEPDAERLAASGLIEPGSWKRLPYGGVVNRTPLIILVRPGNPKHIRDFSDLARPGIEVVHPDPLTSGGASWAILAEYGAGSRSNPDRAREAGYELLVGLWRNVVTQAQSARSARTQFENGFGDALVTYEQEPLWDRAHGTLHSEIVYPPSTILSEHILVVIERNVDPGQRKLVDAVVEFLWSERAQRLFVKAGFRSVQKALNAQSSEFGEIYDPFLVGELGGWDRAKKEIVDDMWKNRVLKKLGHQP